MAPDRRRPVTRSCAAGAFAGRRAFHRRCRTHFFIDAVSGRSSIRSTVNPPPGGPGAPGAICAPAAPPPSRHAAARTDRPKVRPRGGRPDGEPRTRSSSGAEGREFIATATATAAGVPGATAPRAFQRGSARPGSRRAGVAGRVGVGRRRARYCTGLGLLTFIIVMALVGLVVGAFARLALPGRDPMSIPMTIGIGLAGSFVGGLIGRALFGEGGGSILLSIICAAIHRLLRAPLAWRQPDGPGSASGLLRRRRWRG